MLDSALGAYVQADREALRALLDRSLARIDEAEDRHRVDPETGMTRAQWEDMWSFLS